MTLLHAMIEVYAELFPRFKKVNYAEGKDEIYHKLKEGLKEEFDLVLGHEHEGKYDAIRSASSYLLWALTKLQHENYTGAKEDFTLAYEKGKEGFEHSTGFPQQTLAIKVRIVATLHLKHYFDDNQENKKIRAIRDFLYQIWDDFRRLSVVTQAIDEHLSGDVTVFHAPGHHKHHAETLEAIRSIRHTIKLVVNETPLLVDSAGRTVGKGIHLEGHLGEVKCLYLWNNQLLISGGADSTILLWDLTDLPMPVAPSFTLKKHANSVTSICANRSKGHLYTSSNDGYIYAWDLSNAISTTNDVTTINFKKIDNEPIGELFEGIDCHILSMCTNASENLLFVGTNIDGGGILVWDISDKALPDSPLVRLDGHTAIVTCLTATDKYLFSGSSDTNICVWDIFNRENSLHTAPISVLRGHHDRVDCLCLTDHPQRLYSGSYDGTIRVWDASPLAVQSESSKPAPLAVLKPNLGLIKSMAIGSRQQLYIGSSNQHCINIWDVTNPNKVSADGSKDTVNVLLKSTPYLSRSKSSVGKGEGKEEAPHSVDTINAGEVVTTMIISNGMLFAGGSNNTVFVQPI